MEVAALPVLAGEAQSASQVGSPRDPTPCTTHHHRARCADSKCDRMSEQAPQELPEVGMDTSGAPPLPDASADDGVAEVVRKLCPVLRMHHEEKYFPCSAEWFIQRSELRYLTKGMKEQDVFELIAPEGQVTEELLREEPKKPKYDATTKANLQLHIAEKYAGGFPVDKLDNVPIYAHVKRVMSPPDLKYLEAMEINYMTLYAWNGSYPVFGLPFAQAGAHPGDWEHLTVRTDAAGKPQALWYNAHRNRDGCWLPWDSVPVTSCGRPIAFVAKFGHGIYPTPGLQARALLAANDYTSDKGPVWAPNKVVLIQDPQSTAAKEAANRGTSYQLYKPPRRGSSRKQQLEAACKGGNCLPELVIDSTSAWTAFPGRWGEITAPMLQAWYTFCEPPMSRTKLQRIFHFIKEKPLPDRIYRATTAASSTVSTTVADVIKA